MIWTECSSPVLPVVVVPVGVAGWPPGCYVPVVVVVARAVAPLCGRLVLGSRLLCCRLVLGSRLFSGGLLGSGPVCINIATCNPTAGSQSCYILFPAK